MAKSTSFNPDFSDSPIQASEPGENTEPLEDTDLSQNLSLKNAIGEIKNAAGLDDTAVNEAIGVGREIGDKVLNSMPWNEARGIDRTLEDVREADKETPPALQGSVNPFRRVTQVAAAIMGNEGQGLKASNAILEGAAFAANAANLIPNFLNSPLGRRLTRGGRQAQYNAYWNIVGATIPFNIGKEVSSGLRPSITGSPAAPGSGATLTSAGNTISRTINETEQRPEFPTGSGAEKESLGEAASNAEQIVSDTNTWPVHDEKGKLEEEANTISEIINDSRLWPNRSEGSRDPRAARGTTSPMSPESDILTAGENIRDLLYNEERHQNYPGNSEKSDEARDRVRDFKNEREMELTEVAGEDSQLQSDVVNNTKSVWMGGAEGNALQYQDNFSNGGDLGDPGKEFLRWASHRLRWGNAFTHLFEVTIEDAEGYGAVNTDHQPLDFSEGAATFSFACTAASVKGMNLGIERTGGQDLPLLSDATVDQGITLTILDYTRMSLLNYFYSWWLSFYNPHKRRYVSGRAGKYKNIRIKVQALYGDYYKEGADANEDSPNFGSGNNRYQTTVEIQAFNCILTSFPGLDLDWSRGGEPFSFDVDIMPADVYYDFRNPQSYTRQNPRNHLINQYGSQIAEGRRSPDDITRGIDMEDLA